MKYLPPLLLVFALSPDLAAQVTTGTGVPAHKKGTYFSIQFSTGQVSFKNARCMPKVQFPYSYLNAPGGYNYSDSLQWSAHQSHPFYGGLGLEYGALRGFYGAIGFDFYSKVGWSFLGNLTFGYQLPIARKISIRGSLSFSHVETSQKFRSTIDTNHKDASVLGNVFQYQYSTTFFERNFLGQHGSYQNESLKVAMHDVSSGIIPKIEISDDINAHMEVRLGVGYWLGINDQLRMSLMGGKSAEVKLDTPGLQFSDGISSKQVFDYQGLLWSVTVAFKANL